MRWVMIGVVVAVGIAGLAAWSFRPIQEPSAAEAPSLEEHEEMRTRPPAPRLRDLPPLPATEDPDTGFA